MQISWEVRNRFRLFREERDFLLHTDSARGGSILASEQALELQSDGRGWARNTVNRLCIDLSGRVTEPCTRDNVKESYLTPLGSSGHGTADRSRFRSAPPAPGRSTMAAGRRCTRPSTAPSRSICGCAMAAPRSPASTSPAGPGSAAAPLDRDRGARSVHRRPRRQHRFRRRQSGSRDRARRRRFLLPLLSRQRERRSTIARAAPATRAGGPARRRTRCRTGSANSALWFNAACHRSLYSYQTRTALALAVQYPHIAVTYLPLACTGATIADGLFGPQRARECPPTKSGGTCPGTVRRAAGRIARRRSPPRSSDSPTASSI